MTTAEPTPLTIRVPVDELARYAGLTAIASTVLAIAGILATAAYLTAWGVPSLVVRMDPLTAALRSESVRARVALSPTRRWTTAPVSDARRLALRCLTPGASP